MFSNVAERNSKYTSIIGSSNLTGGGLTTNFEVNSIIREDTPKYFDQLTTIYNEIKFTESIFCPDAEYIAKYNNVQTQLTKSDNAVDKYTQLEIDDLRETELSLPGTVPTIMRQIIDCLLEREKQGERETSVADIYTFVKRAIEEKGMPIKTKTLNNSIRERIYRNMADEGGDNNTGLFRRTKKGTYALTDEGREYTGR